MWCMESPLLNTALHRPKEHPIFFPAVRIPIPHIKLIRNLPRLPAEVFRQLFGLVTPIFPLPRLAARQGKPYRFLPVFQQAPHHDFSPNGKFHFIQRNCPQNLMGRFFLKKTPCRIQVCLYKIYNGIRKIRAVHPVLPADLLKQAVIGGCLSGVLPSDRITVEEPPIFIG